MNIILITCTYKRKHRLEYIRRAADVFSKQDDITWIIVEDAATADIELGRLLDSYRSSMDVVYLATGPTRDKGNQQRALALQYIVAHKLEGVVYNADDDNMWDAELFQELRKVKRVGVLPVRNLGPGGVELPVVVDGKIIGWNAGWLERKYPVDMGGFAFHTDCLKKLQAPYWDYTGIGGESEFIDKLIKDKSELELLCSNCSRCYVRHNDLF